MKNLILLILFSLFLALLVYISVVVIYTILSKKELSTKYGNIWRFFNRYTLDRVNKVNKNLCFGFSLFCGRQGGGKTYAAVTYALKLAQKHNSVLISNTPLNIDGGIDYIYCQNISDIPYCLSSERHNIIILDEIQTLFDSRQFDDEFYSMFCQLRKRNIKLIGTSQVFERCALKLREQVHNLYYCRTYYGCLTRVREYYPMLNSSGKLSQKDIFGLGDKFIIQSEYIRNMYNTFYKI